MAHASSQIDADLIIAGAGAAGLSALWFALHSHARHRRIVVVDRDFEVGDDRTWAFWGTSTTPFAHLADAQWDQLKVRFPGWEATGTLRRPAGRSARGRRTYMRVRRQRFDREVLSLAERSPNVRFVAQDVLDIADEPGAGAVVLPEGELRASTVLQSVRPSPSSLEREVRHPLRQHFGGWEVRTEFPVFTQRIATLMDFDTAQHDGSAFFYVLPEAPDRAMVEHTVFSLRPRSRAFYDEHIAGYLSNIGAGRVDVLRTEYGCIPMEDRKLEQRWGKHVWSIGTVGGCTKPTSGYTFQRIHAQTRHLVAGWACGAPAPLPPAPHRYAFADRTLLNVLHHQPELGRSIFERLFRNSSIDDVLSFLGEDTRWHEDARMIRGLPRLPFLRAAASEMCTEALQHLRRPSS